MTKVWHWICRAVHRAAIVFSVVYAAVVLVVAAIFEPDLTRWLVALILPLTITALLADVHDRKLKVVEEKLDRILKRIDPAA